jgi:hypothetical protein
LKVQPIPKLTHRRRPVKVQKIGLQDTKTCYVTGRTDVEEHHCIYGKNRKNADKYGLTVWPVAEYHTGAKGVHNGNLTLDTELKQLAQKEFEKVCSHAEWMRVFGRDYLES